MSEEEIQKIADLVAEKIIDFMVLQQKKYDEYYDIQYFDYTQNDTRSEVKADERDALADELESLIKLLAYHIEQEEYMKAAEVDQRINKIRDRLNKMK